MKSILTMSQQRCSNFKKLYLELLNSSRDDPYIVENLMKSSTTFVYNVYPDSDFNLAENRKYQICPNFETVQKHLIVNIISLVLLIQISSSLYRLKASQMVYNFCIDHFSKFYTIFVLNSSQLKLVQIHDSTSVSFCDFCNFQTIIDMRVILAARERA